MKNKTMILFAALAAAICLAPLAAHAQVVPKTATALTTSTNVVDVSATATVTSSTFTANSKTGFAVLPAFSLSGTGTLNVTFNFNASVDGTTWTTTNPVSYAVAANGTNAVVGYAAFPAAPAYSGGPGVAQVRYWRLGSIQNANTTGTMTLQSLTVTKAAD
jgi:hypothetical protein